MLRQRQRGKAAGFSRSFGREVSIEPVQRMGSTSGLEKAATNRMLKTRNKTIALKTK
jgi:hypothetical protein